jgi:hypothetical protein
MEILTEHVGYNHGQHNFRMRTVVVGRTIGVLSFSEFEGKPYVSGIGVEEPHRRRGVARRMIEQLQLRYPEEPIDFGGTTDDGAKMLARIDFRIVTNLAHASALEDRKRIEVRLREFEETAERLQTATGELREELSQALEGWNEVWDALEDAEYTILTEPRYLKFVNVLESVKDEADTSDELMHR